MLAPRAGRWLGPVGLLGLVALATAAVSVGPLRALSLGAAIALGAAFAFLAVFFRDPERPVGDGIVSAADGTVRAVERIDERWRISVFMNVTNVHVNRFPIDATVESVEGSGAGYRPAYAADAERNVQRRYRLATDLGAVEVVQITGIVARRLVPFVGPGDHGRKGDRLGMIVLGSRVDVLVPADRAVPAVERGVRVRAGVSTIARIRT